MQLASPVLAEVANELRQACVVGSLGGWQHHYPPYYGKKAGDPPTRATTALLLAFALTSGKGVRILPLSLAVPNMLQNSADS